MCIYIYIYIYILDVLLAGELPLRIEWYLVLGHRSQLRRQSAARAARLDAHLRHDLRHEQRRPDRPDANAVTVARVLALLAADARHRPGRVRRVQQVAVHQDDPLADRLQQAVVDRPERGGLSATPMTPKGDHDAANQGHEQRRPGADEDGDRRGRHAVLVECRSRESCSGICEQTEKNDS